MTTPTKEESVKFLNTLFGLYFLMNDQLRSESIAAIKLGMPGQIAKSLDASFKAEMKKAVLGKEFDSELMSQSLKSIPGFEFSPPVAKLISRFYSYFRNQSGVAVKALAKASTSPVFPSWIRSGFLAEETSQSSVAEELKKFVREVSGESSTELSREDADALRENDPVSYKEYGLLRRKFNQAWKDAASNFVRSSGDPTVPMVDLIEYLDSKKMKYQIVPGFEGRVNADLEWFTADDERIGGVPSVMTFSHVEMNDDPQPGKYVFTAIPYEDSTGSKPKYFYRVSDALAKRQKKYSLVADVLPVIKKARSIWIKGIKVFDVSDPKTVAALMIELSYQFSSRIGGKGNSTAGSATYGLSTLRVGHVKFTSNGFTVSYEGKAGVFTNHKYVVKEATSRQVYACMKELVDGKSKDDFVFTYALKNGEHRTVNPSVVNQVFKKVVGNPDITIHKLRTLRATSMFGDMVDDYISKTKTPPTAKQLIAKSKEFALAVGKELNHVRTAADGEPRVTPTTALGSYIDFSVQANLFDHFGIPRPDYLVKLMGNHRIESSIRLLSAAMGEDEDEEPVEPSDESDTYSDEILDDKQSPEEDYDLPEEEDHHELMPDDSDDTSNEAEEPEDGPEQPDDEEDTEADESEEESRTPTLLSEENDNPEDSTEDNEDEPAEDPPTEELTEGEDEPSEVMNPQTEDSEPAEKDDSETDSPEGDSIDLLVEDMDTELLEEILSDPEAAIER